MVLINKSFCLFFSLAVILSVIIFEMLSPLMKSGTYETVGFILIFLLSLIVYLVYIMAKEKSWFMFFAAIITNLSWFTFIYLHKTSVELNHLWEIPLLFLRLYGIISLIYTIIYFIVWKIQVINK